MMQHYERFDLYGTVPTLLLNCKYMKLTKLSYDMDTRLFTLHIANERNSLYDKDIEAILTGKEYLEYVKYLHEVIKVI